MMKSELKLQQRNVIQTHKKPSPIIAIKNLTWKPARISNDKIYDIWVEFDFTAKNGAKRAYITLKPLKYANLPANIFPYENDRQISINLYGVKNGKIKVRFNNLKGGREYHIKAKIVDLRDEQKTRNAKTNYIRQFENFGKTVLRSGIIVGVTYKVMMGYYIDWKTWGPFSVHPLLGEYDSLDPIVIAKHIDWITGHGINCLFLGWGIDDEELNLQNHMNILKFLSNNITSQVMISIGYDISRLDYAGIRSDENGLKYLTDEARWKTIVGDFKLMSMDLFGRKNFLKIEGRPVVYFYGSDALRGNVKAFLSKINNEAGYHIYFISDHAHPWAAEWVREAEPRGEWKELAYALLFDAWSVWAGGWWSPVKEPLNQNYPKFLDKGYNIWRKIANKYRKQLVPSIIPGFVELRDPEWLKNYGNLPRDVGMFKKLLKIALRYATRKDGYKIIRIDEFNEFGEGTAIEPTIEEGFTYLEAVQEVLLNVISENKP